MANPGVHVYEKATAVSTPVTADVGIPFAVGVAPVHAATKAAKANVPVLATSWDEAVEKLGFSDDWKSYPLCEVIYSHFQLFGCQPVVFCNVLDIEKMKTAAEAKDFTVIDHKAVLPFGMINDDTLVVMSDSSKLVRDEDYSVLYDESVMNGNEKGACIVELLSGGSAYEATTLNIAGNMVDPAAPKEADIVTGVAEIDACMNRVGVIPDLIIAPGWSHLPGVAAVMATKAAGINGLFRAKALIDVDCGVSGVKQYSDLVAYKAKNNLVDENEILCWPQMKLGERQFHMSTQLAGLMAQVDTANGGIPYESPSNKNFQMDTCCLESGEEISLTFEQANMISSYGIVTALNFMSSGWTCRNNYTACYPGNTDVKDYFIPVSRMFDFVANTLIRTFWAKLDKPMVRRLIDTILDTCNIWLSGLVGSEYLLGARAVLLDSENPKTDLMNGIIRIHIYITPPSPAQEIDFTLEYDVAYVAAALAA